MSATVAAAPRRTGHPDLVAELVVTSASGSSPARLRVVTPDRFVLEVHDPAVLAEIDRSPAWRHRAQVFADRGHRVDVSLDGEVVCSLGAIGA